MNDSNLEVEQTTSVPHTPLGYALFGLGLYIDHCIHYGQQTDELQGFMQAYLDIFRLMNDPESPRRMLADLLAQKVHVAPDVLEELNTYSPSWLPLAEKARLREWKEHQLAQDCDGE